MGFRSRSDLTKQCLLVFYSGTKGVFIFLESTSQRNPKNRRVEKGEGLRSSFETYKGKDPPLVNSLPTYYWGRGG